MFILLLFCLKLGGTVELSESNTPTFADNRCNETWTPTPTTVNTTQRLLDLRKTMREYNISAYIIASGDNHQSEYVMDHDSRRSFISGFSGSAGDAVVTLEAAALWTDSRYYIQAEEQLDCNWLLMKSGESSTPNMPSWLASVLPPSSLVSSDPKVASFGQWMSWKTDLEGKNLSIIPISQNLVDLIWTSENGRPDYPNATIIVLDISYAGESWEDKVVRLRQSMSENGIDMLILSALDEVAWTLNLRAKGVPFTPVFRSYLVIQNSSATLYAVAEELTSQIYTHLNNNNSSQTNLSVEIKEYEDFWDDLEEFAAFNSSIVGLPSQYSYALGVSYQIHSAFANNKVKDLPSPALLMKDYKNSVEEEGMRNAHIKDAVALCVFLARLENSLKEGAEWTELKVVQVLDDLRKSQSASFGPSFETIAASGINSALPHYQPSNVSNSQITMKDVMLLDSGGQYLDGTTDVTRTLHFGTPRDIEKTVYTELLKGCIDLVTTTFPVGTSYNALDLVLRRPLFSLGLNYGHGSTHGIGSFLGVHEAYNSIYHKGFFGSQEPGYYRENDFGMRLENIVEAVQATPMSGDPGYLTFEVVTLVPYQANLIDKSKLDTHHITWLNNYNRKIREKVGEEMLRLQYGQMEYDWLIKNTNEI